MTATPQPDWRQDLLRSLIARRKHRRRKYGFMKAFQLRLTPDMLELVDKAARERGINRAGYVRRAIAHFVAKDLGLNWRDVLASSPAPLDWGQNPQGTKKSSNLRDDGTGYGRWNICD